MSSPLGNQPIAIFPEKPCSEAHDYLKRFADESLAEGSKAWDTCENPFSIKMSLEDFEKLKEDLRIDQPSHFNPRVAPQYWYPKYAYDSKNMTLTIRCTPSPFHMVISGMFYRALMLACSFLPASVELRINYEADETIEDFIGDYFGSRQAPNFAVQVRDDLGINHLKLVLEIGFGITYEELAEEAMKWLEGKPEVSVVVLIMLEETKAAEMDPMAALDLNEDKYECLDSVNLANLNSAAFDLVEDFGPARFKDIEWVGKISTTFMEVWKRDNTGSPVQDRPRIDLLASDENSESTNLKLSHFLAIAPEDDRRVVIGRSLLCSGLNYSVKELALHRCQRVMRTRISGTSSPLKDISNSQLPEPTNL